MRIAIEAQRIFRKDKHGMDFVILETLKEYREMVKPYVCDTSLYLWNALKE